jgi:hypothetical protein
MTKMSNSVLKIQRGWILALFFALNQSSLNKLLIFKIEPKKINKTTTFQQVQMKQIDYFFINQQIR